MQVLRCVIQFGIPKGSMFLQAPAYLSEPGTKQFAAYIKTHSLVSVLWSYSPLQSLRAAFHFYSTNI